MELWGVAGKTEAGGDRAADAFWQHGVRARRRLPAPYHKDDAEKRCGVEHEDGSWSSTGDEQPADRWPNRPREVEAGAVQRDCRRQFATWNQFGHDGLPGWRAECAA